MSSALYSRKYEYPEGYRHHAAPRDEYRQAFLTQRLTGNGNGKSASKRRLQSA